MDVTALPYCGGPPLPADLLGRWNLDPLLIAGLAALFFAGRALGARTRPLAGGVAILAVLFVSPLCALSSSLFAMRVTHHVALTSLAAPLLAAAMLRGGGNIAGWTAAHAVLFWVWHAPPVYAFALASDGAYWLMQASLLGSAVGFWRSVRGVSPPMAVAALLVTMVQMGLLGALLTFSAAPLYAWHWTTTQGWGLTPLADQQLAGLIMWVVGSAIYLLAALRRASDWIGPDRRLARA
ncbi:cytochrome c oxidase assembly protein [Sphingobium xenophagum]|uniref:cytochrome c oxidase assembly protein n=1 Tax=Sphingobium xenophagum TaxID=121428 RepID=UPI001C0DD466|nr:cytochrome c oxidase assembly protein [Sphingobium xenophagum]QWT16675.1 cytochrome c oxidase assembly protein [Sphingobium xenophagum]